MITIKQTYKRIEDGHGEVTCVFVVSDKHLGLFQGMSGYIDSSGIAGTYSSGYSVGAAAITAITKASECVITIPDHSYLGGEIITISGTVDAAWDAVFKNQSFIVSDVSGDTFKIKHADIDIDLFIVGDVEEKISDKIGGMITSQLSFEINEHNVKTPTDVYALQFVIDALNPAIFRYCGYFFDPVQTTRAQNESRHLGVIQPEINDDALVWKSVPWSSTTGSINKRKFTAKPIFRDFFDAIPLKDLILGSDDDTVPGIDSSWEAANVADRQGWFSRDNTDGDGAYTDMTMVYSIVNFNKLLRKLADNLIQALINKGLGEFQIIFDRSVLDGKYLPTRWQHNISAWHDTFRYPRFTQWLWPDCVYKFNFFVRGDEGVSLVIDPDSLLPAFIGSGLDDMSVVGDYTGKTSKTYRVQIDGNGSPDTFKWSDDGGETWEATGVSIAAPGNELSDGIWIKFDALTGHNIGDYWESTPVTMYESIWLNYNLFKLHASEPNTTAAKNFVFSQNDDVKSFTELLTGIAVNFGMFVKFYYTDSTTIHIQFISREGFTGVQCYLRDVEKANRKLTGIIQESDKYYSVANYNAGSGDNYYKKFRASGNGGTLKGITYEALEGFSYGKTGKKLWFSISPTTAQVYDLSSSLAFDLVTDDKGAPFHKPRFPHNHYARRKRGGLYENTEDFFLDTFGLHTAIYMYVDKRTDTYLHEHEPAQYWTPAGAFSVKIDNTDKIYWKLEDYINFINGRDDGYFQSEFNIDLPFWNGFSVNSDGSSESWQALGLGKVIALDGINYIVTSIKFKGDEPNTSLILQGSGRFSDIGIPDTIADATADVVPPLVHNLPAASGTVTALNILSANSDGTYSRAETSESYHGTIAGLAMNDAADTESVLFAGDGILECPDWEEILGETINPGDILTLKNPDTGIDNIELNGQLTSGQLYCRLGIFETSTRLKIDIKEFWVE